MTIEKIREIQGKLLRTTSLSGGPPISQLTHDPTLSFAVLEVAVQLAELREALVSAIDRQ